MKATKKELYKALHLACFEKIRENLPSGKCEGCIVNFIEECPKCWLEYYLEKARKENER